jgi:hypothetical protein
LCACAGAEIRAGLEVGQYVTKAKLIEATPAPTANPCDFEGVVQTEFADCPDLSDCHRVSYLHFKVQHSYTL